MNINNSILFGSDFDTPDNLNCTLDYLEIQETLNRTHIKNEIIFSNDEIAIETYLYINNNLDYITNYIFPFWKNEFLFNSKNTLKTSKELNPFSSWTNTEIAKYYMGLKENTRCFELKISDITIGFASVLLLDEFNWNTNFSEFSNEKNNNLYDNSALFYNFVIEKPFRKMGYGRVFLEQIINYIKKKYNYNYLILHVNNDNELAISLYSKFGFKFVSINPSNNSQNVLRLSFTDV